MPRTVEIEGINDRIVDLFTRGAAVIEAIKELAMRPSLGRNALVGHSPFYVIARSIKSRPEVDAGTTSKTTQSAVRRD